MARAVAVIAVTCFARAEWTYPEGLRFGRSWYLLKYS